MEILDIRCGFSIIINPKKFDTAVTLYLKYLKVVEKKLTAFLALEDSSYLFDAAPMTSPASDFLDVKPKIITNNENHLMIPLYIGRLELDD